MAEQGLKKKGTVLFCDIRNFTKLFDEQDPIRAFEFANSVLAVLGESIEESGGIVDRFTGDGFLAHFGILESQPDHALQACKAAINLRRQLKEINNQRYFDLESVVSFGIGIHSGTLAYGQIKTRQLSQKTVLGDVVNTASRIEKLTKDFVLDILVSGNVYGKTKSKLEFQKMPLRKVKGKKNKIQTYWLLPINFAD